MRHIRPKYFARFLIAVIVTAFLAVSMTISVFADVIMDPVTIISHELRIPPVVLVLLVLAVIALAVALVVVLLLKQKKATQAPPSCPACEKQAQEDTKKDTEEDGLS